MGLTSLQKEISARTWRSSKKFPDGAKTILHNCWRERGGGTESKGSSDLTGIGAGGM